MIPAVDQYYSDTGLTADVEPAIAAGPRRRLLGWSIRESAGSPAVATVSIVLGEAVSGGTPIGHVELAANGSETKWFGPQGIDVRDGVSLDIAGGVDVVLWWTA